MKVRKPLSILLVTALCFITFFSLAPMTVHASSAIPNGTYRIMAKCGKFMDIKHGSDENGAIAHLWQFADVESQKFYVENVSENLYKITPIHSNKSLEVRDSSFENCAEIAQWDYVDGYDCKLWYIYERENGYFNIVNKNSGKYMDVAGNGIENGTQIWQYEGNDTDAQLFGFIPTEIKFIQGPLVNNIEYVLPKKNVYHLAHTHKNGKWFCFLVNDTSGDMYLVSGRICSECGDVITYTSMPLPN